MLAELERGVAEVNKHFSQVEGIKRFAVLADEWVPDSPQLTADHEAQAARRAGRLRRRDRGALRRLSLTPATIAS